LEVIPTAAVAAVLILGWASVGAGAWNALFVEHDWLEGGAALALFLIGAAVLAAIAVGRWRGHPRVALSARIQSPETVGAKRGERPR
jgi:hypothetical protein